MTPTVIYNWNLYLRSLQVFSVSLSRKVHELKMEKRKADALTYQMLPPSVAKVTLTWSSRMTAKYKQLWISVLSIQNMPRIIHFMIDSGVPAEEVYERPEVWFCHNLLQWPGWLHPDGGGEHSSWGNKPSWLLWTELMITNIPSDGDFPKLLLQNVWQQNEQVWHIQGVMIFWCRYKRCSVHCSPGWHG